MKKWLYLTVVTLFTFNTCFSYVISRTSYEPITIYMYPTGALVPIKEDGSFDWTNSKKFEMEKGVRSINIKMEIASDEIAYNIYLPVNEEDGIIWKKIRDVNQDKKAFIIEGGKANDRELEIKLDNTQNIWWANEKE